MEMMQELHRTEELLHKGLKEINDKIAYINRTDLLTGVLNRNAMNERIAGMRADPADPSRPQGVIFADMNGLKYTNDHLGHDAGDRLLKNAAMILRSTFTGAEIFRAGGDEFLILLPEATEEGIRGKIADMKKKAELFDNVSFAAGGCCLNPDTDIRDAMSEADARMYRDKGNFYRKYPELKRDEDYTSEDNLLYQFITYHLLPERLSANNLVYHYNEKGFDLNRKVPSVAVMEFYTTMGKRRLLKIFESKESNGVYLNRFPNLDNGRQGTYQELSCDPDKEGIAIGQPNLEGENNIRNGIIYPIDKLLYYSDETRNNLQKQRIRWSVPSMWPEFMNNDIRCSEITDDKHKNVYIPTDEEYKYLEDVEISKETRFNYWTGRGNGWQNMQGDEMSIRGLLECTMRLPPVPRRGTYELRFAIQCGGNMRGMVQFYWGSDKSKLAAMGIPLDLRQSADNQLHTKNGNVPSDIGYERDTDDEDYNIEVDKRLRNNGFMKGCNQYCAGGPGTSTMMRLSDICVRRIILRETMDPDVTYYIKFKTVMDDDTRFFYMDYLEYCAKDVYDNPEKPEDIW